MLSPLLAGVPGWQIAVGLLVPPMALLLFTVVVALVLHWAIERWAPGPSYPPGDTQ